MDRKLLELMVVGLCVGIVAGFLLPEEAASAGGRSASTRNTHNNRYNEIAKIVQELKARKGKRTGPDSGSSRVSHAECQVDAYERLECGYFGIAREECASRDCCWQESKTRGVPWCFHTITNSQEECVVSPRAREDCGYYGINMTQCKSQGCCWRPSQVQNAPWCFYPAGM